MDSQEKMAYQVYLASKENLPKRASRVSVDQVGIQVLLGLQEEGVHLVCQASVDQENLERRAVREVRAFLELPDHLVPKVSQVKE